MTNEFPGQTIQVPIETVYLDANASSHYRSIRDSLTIGAIFVKFFFLSISTTVLDYLVFSLAYYHTREILCSFVIARIASILYNFSLSRYLVFKVKTNLAKQLAKYVVLVAAFMCLSWGLTELLFRLFGLYVVLGKLMSEAGLFLLSWFVQRRFIFTPKGNKTATR
jgi:putative flippase GtrA